MPTLTIEYHTDAERLDLERVIAYAVEMRELGRNAAHGTVLDACETFALTAGRAMLRDNLAAVAQARADAQKKSPAAGPRGDSPAT